MARQKQQDQQSANSKPNTQSAGKSMADAPEGERKREQAVREG